MLHSIMPIIIVIRKVIVQVICRTQLTTIYQNQSDNNKYEANLRLEMEWKIDSLNTLIFQPNINYNTTDSYTDKEYSYLTAGDSTSWGNTFNKGTNNSISGGFNMIYNRKFASKKGRSFTLNLNTGFSNSDNLSTNISNKYTADTTIYINQQTKNTSNKYNYGMRMSFVEPLWNLKNMIEVAASLTTLPLLRISINMELMLTKNYTILILITVIILKMNFIKSH